jgi:DnaD/phage-associated family protein
MSKQAFYFPHDSNAKDDPKCVMLIEQLGLEGYGTYWVLIETLRDQPGYRYPVALIPAIARRYNTSAEKMNTVIRKYGLFDVDEDTNEFYSPSLIRRMEPLDTKREQNRLAGKLSAQKRMKINTRSTHVQHMLNAGSTSVQPEEKSRVEESRVEKNKEEESRVDDSATPSSNVYGKLFALYESNIGMLTPIIVEKIKSAINDYPFDWIEQAIIKSTSLEKRSWGYVEGVLRGWKRDGMKTSVGGNGNGHKPDPLWD